MTVRVVICKNHQNHFNRSVLWRYSNSYTQCSVTVGNPSLGSLKCLYQGYILYTYVWTAGKHHISYVRIFLPLMSHFVNETAVWYQLILHSPITPFLPCYYTPASHRVLILLLNTISYEWKHRWAWFLSRASANYRELHNNSDDFTHPYKDIYGGDLKRREKVQIYYIWKIACISLILVSKWKCNIPVERYLEEDHD